MLTCRLTEVRGLVSISGLVPNGLLSLHRQENKSPWSLVRGSENMIISTGGFKKEDNEAPIGVPLTYRALSTPTDRIIQRNLVNSPDFSRGVQSWTAGAGRTLTISAGQGQVTSNPSGTGVTGRTIAEVGVSQLLPSTTYLVAGMAKFTTPAVWTWQDVKDFGTWQNVDTAKASWAEVRSSETDTGAIADYSSIHVSLSNGGTDYVAAIQAFQVPLSQSGQWINFSVYITTPAVIPSTARLRILHGTNTRSLSNAWSLDKFSISTAADVARPYRLFWFNGDTPVPNRPQDYLMQDSEWEDYSFDSTITWEGVAGNSASRFTAPSRIYTLGKCQLEAPEHLGLCEPILLSDPVASAQAVWFSLAEISSLNRAARSSVFAPLGRKFYVSSSSVRGSATGELTVYTNTLDELAAAISLFESGRVLLLRNPDPSYPETMWYLSIGDVEEYRTLPNARRPERAWVIPFVRVERPTGLIEASTGTTWVEVRDGNDNWQGVQDDNTDWLGVLTDAQ